MPILMRPPRLALVLIAVFVVLPVLVPVGSAAPPPEGVCGVCGSAFERSAQQAGIGVTVVESNLTVRVTDDGDSHWTAHATVNSAAADQFAANRTLLDRVVERTYASSRTVVDDPRDLSVGLEERTVTVTFVVEDVTHRSPGGVLLFDGFVGYPPNGTPYVDADRLTVRGPPDTSITHTPPGSTVTGNQSVWTISGDDRTDSPRLGREATIAFASDNGPVARIATAGAVRAHALSMISTELRAYALLPAILLGLVATGLLLAGDPLPKITLERTIMRWLAASVGLYIAVTAIAFLTIDDDFGFILGVVGVGLAPQTFLTATVAVLAPRLDVDSDGSATRFAAVVVLAWTLALVLGAPTSALLVYVLGPLVFLPFGVLAATGHWARLAFPVVAALGAVVAALPLVPRVGVVFVSPLMLTMLLSGSALLGIPLFAIGWRLGGNPTQSADTADRPTETVS